MNITEIATITGEIGALEGGGLELSEEYPAYWEKIIEEEIRNV